jgi:hypothetical protein
MKSGFKLLSLVLLALTLCHPVSAEDVITRYHRVAWDGLKAFPIEKGIHNGFPDGTEKIDAPFRLCYDSIVEATWKNDHWLGIRFRGGEYAVQLRGTRPWGDEPNLPSTTPDGDFSPTETWHYWTVVDEDPQGLNGRLLESYEMDLTTKGTPGLAVPTWPVVERFPTGILLNAGAYSQGPDSKNHWLLDDRGHPWLLVKRRGKRSFVRANSRYIRPVLAATFKDRGDR